MTIRRFLTLFIGCLLGVIGSLRLQAQLSVQGTVYDSTRIFPVAGVEVQNLAGKKVYTDSLGRYSIPVSKNDSLVFTYLGKPTPKYATAGLNSYTQFDIALHIRQAGKFRQLREVQVNSKTYREDSIANRDQYRKIFDYQKPGVRPAIDPHSGVVGMDLAEFINMFRFRRNKQLRKMQKRIEEQEQDRYVDYRFNKLLIKRVTRLEGKHLDAFMQQYRPNYNFTTEADIVQFYTYILNASYEYRARNGLPLSR